MVNKRSTKGSRPGRKMSKNPKPATAETSKMTMCTVPLAAPHSPIRERRTERRVASGKRLAMQRAFPGKIRAVTRRSLDPCDNSNDSGLGFDNHVDHHANVSERLAWSDRAQAKRVRLDVKLEEDEINENYGFPETLRTCKNTMSIIRTAPASTAPTLSIHGSQGSSGSRAVPRCTPLTSRSSLSQPVTLTSQLPNASREGEISLRIIQQPEQQHRARYQTEGSRGAVKDRSGNGFPVVQLTGYQKPATLQVFIGTDMGKVAPHMFYQACRVSGKNSTPCMEKKIDGTVVIELQLDPAKDMTGVCDCVGILKERNVDVEHRFPDQIGSRSKKKSTRCRMIFRTSVTYDNGMQETLQVCSQPIVCTQPPGIPEICKKSLTSCPATGGLELFILGKNFLKDTKVFFQQADEQGLRWEQFVIPDKEFLQQTHLVCVIPPYARTDITEPVTVRLLVVSSGKTSEPHQFVYTPTSGAVSSVLMESSQPATFMNKNIWSSVNKHEQGIMPPPDTNQMPLSQRRPSINVTSLEVHSPPLHILKQEIIDDNSQSSIIDPLELHSERRFRNISESSLDVHPAESNMTLITENSMNSMDIMRRSSVSLDAISHNMSENSMSSMNENSMDHGMRRNSGGSIMRENSPVANAELQMTELSTRNLSTALREEIVMDLRMKMPAAAVTVADLASTNAPSLATLQSFGVTEPTSAPLPAQTAQSIESYLSTIETKSINLGAMSVNNNNLQLAQLMSNPNTISQKIIEQVMPTQPLLATTTTQSLAHLGAHLTATFNGVPSSLLSTTDRTSELLAQSTIIPEPNPLQASVDTNLLDSKTVVLANKLLDNGTDGSLHSPQDMLIANKSPLLSTSATQDVLLNPPPQQPLLVATISTSLTSPNLEQVEVNTNPQTASNISPDVILNSQISPSLMCRNNPALPQEALLSTICPTATESSIIQPHTIPESVTQQTALRNTLAPLLTADASSPASLPAAHSPVHQLTSMMGGSEPEKAILFKATVDLLETQKKLNEMETLATATTIEQVIINGILSTSLPTTNGQLSTTGSNLQPTTISTNMMSVEESKDFVIPASNIKGVLNEKKNEDRMIPSGFTTMSENELINIINPSCFDQGNTFH